MLRKIMTATILAAAAMGVNAEDFYLKPAPKGMEMNLPVTVQKSFPNDKARIIFSTMSEAKDLATAQSEVNKTMAEAQQSAERFFINRKDPQRQDITRSRFILIPRKGRLR